MTWVGTNEVVSSYGGSETRNPSFLPRRNPESMNFALGQVSRTNLHALFDRGADTRAGAEVPLRHGQSGNVVKLTLTGRRQPVDWEIEFTPGVGN